jgi:hypothetical protein
MIPSAGEQKTARNPAGLLFSRQRANGHHLSAGIIKDGEAGRREYARFRPVTGGFVPDARFFARWTEQNVGGIIGLAPAGRQARKVRTDLEHP